MNEVKELLGLKNNNVKVLSVEEQIKDDEKVQIITLKGTTNKVRCPICNKYTKSVHDKLKPIKIKYNKVTDRKCYLILLKKRFICHNCKKKIVEDLGINLSNKTISNSLEIKIRKDLLKPNFNIKQIADDNDVSTQFSTSQLFASSTYLTTTGINEVDSHMMKNMEWGAVAYLKQSKYGLGLIDIAPNNYYGTSKEGVTISSTVDNSSIHNLNMKDESDVEIKLTALEEEYEEYNMTGCGSEVGTTSSSTTCNVYNSEIGVNSSTTGNVYGVYDMSGGAYEYVMGVMEDNTNTDTPMSKNSGFDTNFPNKKYFDLYEYGKTETDQAAYNRRKLGDATGEVRGWYGDYADFVQLSNPWFVRGGYYINGSYAGVFYFDNAEGIQDAYGSWRAVLTPLS